MSLNNKFYSRYTNNTRIIQQFSFSFLANFLHNFSQFKYQPYLAKFKIKQSYSWLAKRFFRIRIFLRRIFPKNQHPIINTINKISSRKRESNGRIRNRSKWEQKTKRGDLIVDSCFCYVVVASVVSTFPSSIDERFSVEESLVYIRRCLSANIATCQSKSWPVYTGRKLPGYWRLRVSSRREKERELEIRIFTVEEQACRKRNDELSSLPICPDIIATSDNYDKSHCFKLCREFLCRLAFFFFFFIVHFILSESDSESFRRNFDTVLKEKS